MVCMRFLGRFGLGILVSVGLAAATSASEVNLPKPLENIEFRPFDDQRAKLGQLLFYDKLLSGNRNIACGTCHNHDFASADGLSLGIGEGGIGLGPDRVLSKGADRPEGRVPRNSPSLFNLGHNSLTKMFHDGRVSADDDYGVGFNTPAEEWLPVGLQSVIAAQALFPMTSEREMAGAPEENDVAAAGNVRVDKVWDVVLDRIKAVPDYVNLFSQAYDDVDGQADIKVAHIGNAIDDFLNSEWRTTNAPFDDYLRGNAGALDANAMAGLDLFYGQANCASCHSGPLLSDEGFYALAIPPLGPGRTRKFDPIVRDLGRMSETDTLADAYSFRTPSLRNVAKTGPWGHNGTYATLEGIIRHHLDPLNALENWDRSQVVLTQDDKFASVDFSIWEDQLEMARFKTRVDIEPRSLEDDQVADIVAFLQTLTDEAGIKGRLGKPTEVPSGLKVD